jgi:HK97 gp10 family phage protein
MATVFEIKGLKETLEVFEQLRNDIGDQKASSKVLIPAVREAMKPVLSMAKALSPKDTGTLDRSLYITARRPTGKDKQSRYVKYQDSVISLVSTKPIPKSLKNKFKASHGHLKGAEYKKTKKAYFTEQGYLADGRAAANEFGTAKMSAQPFLRTSLESQAQSVSATLGQILKQKIEQYKAKNI